MPNADERLTQRSGIETRPMANKGAILVDMTTGRCYRLNRVGAEIWALLRAPLAASEICAEVAKKYEPPPATLEGDVRALVAQLLASQLAEPAPPGTAP